MISNMYAIYHIVIGSVVLLYYSTPAWCHVPFAQPGFLSTPAHIEANVNETILIPCVVHDLGKNVLRWWKDGDLLSDSSDDSLILPPRVTILTNNMLMVDWLEPSDAGNYTCEIVRAYPRLPLEQVHTVRVRHSPQIITVPAGGQVEALLGTEVQMGCMATGWPIPVVTWRFRDEVMKSVDNRHKLIFTADDPQQSGVYVCEANNKVGKPATSNILLRINYAPEIKVEKTWVHSSPGMKTEIECEVTGEPPPKVEWFFNKEPLQVESSRLTYKIRGNKHILSFRSIQESDFGEYICKATNKVGQVERLIELSVAVKKSEFPPKRSQRRDPIVNIEEVGEYLCFGRLTVLEFRKDEIIPIFQSLIPCSGLAYPAVFKKNRGVVSPDSYSLIWEVESYSPIIEYKLMFREANDDRDWIQLIIPADANSPGPLHSKSYTLSGMKLFTVYQARLLSRNRFGWSEPSEIIEFGSNGLVDLVENEVKPISGPITSSDACRNVNAILTVPLTIALSVIQTFPVNL